MRRLLIIVGLFLLSANSAICADMPVKARPYQYYYPAFSWAGTYVGVSGGATAGNFHGPIGTFNFGINFPTYSKFVYGAEADLSLSKLTGSGTCGGCDFEGRWLATARARVGYTFGSTLVFATAGFASGNIQANGPAGTSTSTTKSGYAVGGGAEFDLRQNWSLRADYLHVDLGKVDCVIACGAGGSQFRASSEVLRLGVVYRFFQDEVREFTLAGPGPKRPPPPPD